jgi:preprotein translocase subunit SecD
VVELPGIDDPERIRDLLKGTARLEFRLMPEPGRVASSAREIIEYFEPDTAAAETTTEEGQEAVQEEGTELVQADTAETGTQLTGEDTAEEGPQNPLLAAMQPLPYGESVVFGRVAAADTAQVNDLLRRPDVREMLPSGVELMYSANPVGTSQGGREVFELIGVRQEVELSGEAITDATVQFDQYTNQPSVSMTMNSDGARTWARVTGANVGEQVAIVLDGVIYSYPRVEERIVGGRSSITGLESRAEAQDIVTVLKSGALPAPVDIVEERTVGPSLGQESIRAGFISVVVGLMLVALFMIFYYHTAGMVADLALLLNIILILGILAGFKATLTLPGIAGIVLTIGMAVDANVLIFDRIREEQNTGKTLKASIDAGYEQALSAILDANITTFFVGAILYSFGVGPIQGFAVTLMAGILSSLFTAIIVTRIVFDYLIGERRMSVSYG